MKESTTLAILGGDEVEVKVLDVDRMGKVSFLQNGKAAW